jgi:hypothetical protein
MPYNKRTYQVDGRFDSIVYEQWEGFEMPSQEDIDGQRQLLTIYRRTLHQYLQQRATLGSAYVPPHILQGIDETRTRINQIKQILRDWNVSVENHPNDEKSKLPDFPQLNLKPLNTKHEYGRRKSSSTIAILLAMLITLSLATAVYLFWYRPTAFPPTTQNIAQLQVSGGWVDLCSTHVLASHSNQDIVRDS